MSTTTVTIRWDSANWELIFSAVTSVATLAAVFVALCVALNERRHRLEAEEEQEAQQARTFLQVGLASSSGDDGLTLLIHWQNMGGLPILGPYVKRVVVQGREHRQLRTVGEHQGPAYVRPSEKATLEVLLARDEHEHNLADISAEVSYVDAAGRGWMRWGNAAPRRSRRRDTVGRWPIGVTKTPQSATWWQRRRRQMGRSD